MKFHFLLFFLFFLKNATGWSFNLPKLNSINPYCYVNECCNRDWIKFDKYKLLTDLHVHVYGQPLVHHVADALSAHFNPNHPPSKALTLSFHGWTGGGKNYVSNFIANSIYKAGIKSKYVHHFIGRMHFAEEAKTKEYQRDLIYWLKSNISSCPDRLFIFDEVDKMIPEVLNAIKPMIDHRSDVDGVDYRRAVFIFLSNIGAERINEEYYELFKSGRIRETLKLSDFDDHIKMEAFNQGGGFFKGDILRGDLIDHYIPFLPMEERHVRLCIRHEFKLRNVPDPEQKHLEEVLKIIQWGPSESQVFSKTGCKRIGSQVGLLVEKYYSHLQDKDEL